MAASLAGANSVTAKFLVIRSAKEFLAGDLGQRIGLFRSLSIEQICTEYILVHQPDPGRVVPSGRGAFSQSERTYGVP